MLLMTMMVKEVIFVGLENRVMVQITRIGFGIGEIMKRRVSRGFKRRKYDGGERIEGWSSAMA